jgi:tetratricopeptide (TPR) repeat protein
VYLLGKILRVQGRAEECLAAAREMARLLEPGDAAGRATAAQLEGQALSDLARRDEALARLQEAAALCRDEGIDGLLREVYDDIGAVYNALGDKENTLKYYELAHPDGDDDEEEEEEEEEEEGEGEEEEEEKKVK